MVTRVTTITASEHHEFLHAAVDSQDRVFVGQIFLYTGRFKLSIYKIEDQKIHCTEEIQRGAISHTRLALAFHGMPYPNSPCIRAIWTKKLYFIKLPGV